MANLGLLAFEQIAQPVQNLERAVAFYEGVLGLPHLFTSHNLAFFDCFGVRLLLSEREQAGAFQPGSCLYFTVEDIQASWAELLAAGVTADDPPHLIAHMGHYDLYMAFFRDSEGNPLAISAAVPLEPA